LGGAVNDAPSMSEIHRKLHASVDRLREQDEAILYTQPWRSRDTPI